MRCRTPGRAAKAPSSAIIALPSPSSRVRLAGEHELHGPLRVEQQPLEPLRVAQHQRQPLVGRQAAGEADRQRVRVEHAVDQRELAVADPARRPRRAQPPPHIGHQPRAGRVASPPSSSSELSASAA